MDLRLKINSASLKSQNINKDVNNFIDTKIIMFFEIKTLAFKVNPLNNILFYLSTTQFVSM